MRRCVRVTVLLGMLIAPTAMSAQADESVFLKLRFSANERIRYRIHAEVKGTQHMEVWVPGLQGAAPSDVPVHILINGEGSAKVLRVDPSGQAQLRVQADRLSVKSQFGQTMNTEMLADHGKYTYKVNGRTVDPNRSLLGKKAKIPFVQESVEIKLGPRGPVLELAMPEILNIAVLTANYSTKEGDPIKLPKEALTVGETAEDSSSEVLPGSVAPTDYDIKMTLDAVKDGAKGDKIASVTVNGTSSHEADLANEAKSRGITAAISGTRRFEQQLGGNMQFDVTRGVMLRFDFRADQRMDLEQTIATPNGSQSLRIDFQCTINGAVAKI